MLRTVTSPPSCLASRWQIARPSPVPRGPSRRVGSDPVERLEQAGHLLGGHADARIIDLEDQGSFGARAIHHAPGQTDSAAIGELDRIVDAD